MWVAHYSDGTSLQQYEECKEKLFKDINLEKLTLFEFRVNSKVYKVNLIDGSFDLNNNIIKFENFGEHNNFQLIYFRRVRNTLGNENPEVTFNIGWKTNIDGHVFKRILKISESEKITLGLK